MLLYFPEVGVTPILVCLYFGRMILFHKELFSDINLQSHLISKEKLVYTIFYIPRPPLLLSDTTIDQ